MSTPILPFAVWESGTNQNSVPANDNALRAEILFGLVISKTTDAQPGSPSDGDIYIMTAAASGAQWGAFDADDLAIFKSGTWYAFAPVNGIIVNVNGSMQEFQGSGGYDAIGGGGGSGDVVGPASAVDSTVALYDGTSGKLLKAGSKTVPQLMLQCIAIACSDETTNLTTGTAKVTFRMPFAFTLLSGAAGVRASLTAAQTAGSILTVDINENGTTILSTKLTIDNSEKTSTTAATPPVISDTSLADDAEITVDIDQIGTPLAKGLKVYLIGFPT